MQKSKKKGKQKKKKLKLVTQNKETPRCGLCGKTKKLIRTPCCGQWIGDDEDQYVMFSYARNSCSRNHDRYTLCGYHYTEGHEDDWKTCQECKDDFADELEMYVYNGTNEYNFEKLENPPEYKPTHCSQCGRVIKLSEESFTMKRDDYFCINCMGIDPSIFIR